MKPIQNETVEFQTSGKGDVYISYPFFFCLLKNKDDDEANIVGLNFLK